MYKKRQIVLTQIIVYLATFSGITNISKQTKDGGNFQNDVNIQPPALSEALSSVLVELTVQFNSKQLYMNLNFIQRDKGKDEIHLKLKTENVEILLGITVYNYAFWSMFTFRIHVLQTG